jgi:RimJ/RimL family protein N-acetyltransferase
MTQPSEAQAIQPWHPQAVTQDQIGSLVAFGERNRDYHRSDFLAPPDARAWEHVLADPTQRWYAVWGDHGAVAALICLCRMSGEPWRSAELGAAVDQECSGRGIVSGALRVLLSEILGQELLRVETLIDPRNVASEHLFAAVGFQYEGMSRQALDRGTGRIDVHRWATVAEVLTDDLVLDFTHD